MQKTYTKMQEVFRTVRGTSLYVDLNEGSFYTENLEDVRESLLEDLCSDVLLDRVNAMNIREILNSLTRRYTLS